MSEKSNNLDIVVIGASGHLARTKIYPALFSLYFENYMPESFHVIGYARSDFSTEAFRELLAENLACRYAQPGPECDRKMEDFISRCRYMRGKYDSVDDFRALAAHELDSSANTLFYLAVPPAVFLPASRAIHEAGLAGKACRDAWTRVVIEKPFGSDRESSDALTRDMAAVFDEEQVYRIDHYLGKEVIQNLLVLRFANLIFEPIWNRDFIESIQITWQEDSGVEGRGGYFDSSGIIRDVMQNHLLQILALVAMEPPPRLDAWAIQDEKVLALQSVHPPDADDVVLGQYEGAGTGDERVSGYREDPSVPTDSKTATFAAVVLKVTNRRWDGVPILLRAGKGLNGSKTEIRIQFRDVPANIYRMAGNDVGRNTLVINVQPNEAIYFEIVNKVPGVGTKLESRLLDLQYHTAFEEMIPDAYEDLLLDVIAGEKSLFIRKDELAASWDVFTPLLKEIERAKVQPPGYAFGGDGPEAAFALAARHGIHLPRQAEA